MTVYSFSEQLAIGQEGEAVLDDFFRKRGWKITETTMEDQRRGIDRWYEMSMLADTYSVEYKTDKKSHATGNVYIETVSVGKYNSKGRFMVTKKGWLWTTQSDYLMYYMPGCQRLLLFIPASLRDFVVENEGKYRGVSVKNQGYQGRGLLVPVDDIAKIAKRDLVLTTD